MNDLIFRKASLEDDFEKIASLIYNTDDYIYPFWFETEDNCKEKLPELIKQKKFFFNYENLYLAINKDNIIVGVMCIVDKNTDLDYDYSKLIEVNDRYKYTIENYIYGLIKEVKNAEFAYISNLCVDKEFRNLHIGTFLMENVINEFKEKNFDEIALDVLADNSRAIHLYQKVGFEKHGDNFKGFSNPEEERPDVFSMKNILYKDE